MVNRIEYLLSHMNQPADEVYTRLQAVINEEARARGLRSEENVYSALSKLPHVSDVIRADKGDKLDKNGVDMIVCFSTIDESHVPSVNVQVKSSRDSIRSFRKKIARQQKINLNNVDNYFREHGIVIINGQMPSEDIVASFECQMRAINNYHYGQRGPDYVRKKSSNFFAYSYNKLV